MSVKAHLVLYRTRWTSKGTTGPAEFPQLVRTKEATAATSASLMLWPNGGIPYGRGLPAVVGGNPPVRMTRTKLDGEDIVAVR
jgi:hypothetical protein